MEALLAQDKEGGPAAQQKALRDFPRGAVVYVAIANNFPFFKLGSTGDLKVRAASLRWVMPGGMSIWGFWGPKALGSTNARVLEIDLQARLQRWLCGGEWFHASPESLAQLDAWSRKLPPPVEVPEYLRYRWKAIRCWLTERYAESSK